MKYSEDTLSIAKKIFARKGEVLASEEKPLDPILVALGQRLIDARLDYARKLRPIRTVSQVDIGRALDVTGVTVGNWEAGKNDPGISTLNRLAALYAVRLAWLAAGEGEMREAGATVEPLPQWVNVPIHTNVSRYYKTVAPEAKKRREQEQDAAAKKRRRDAS